MIADFITEQSCSVKNGDERKAYINSAAGRVEFAIECSSLENYEEVMTAWGDAPTVDLEVLPAPPVDTTPSVQEQLDAQAAAIEELASILAEVME